MMKIKRGHGDKFIKKLIGRGALKSIKSPPYAYFLKILSPVGRGAT